MCVCNSFKLIETQGWIVKFFHLCDFDNLPGSAAWSSLSQRFTLNCPRTQNCFAAAWAGPAAPCEPRDKSQHQGRVLCWEPSQNLPPLTQIHVLSSEGCREGLEEQFCTLSSFLQHQTPNLCVGVKRALGGVAQQGPELYFGGVPFQLLCLITYDLVP